MTVTPLRPNSGSNQSRNDDPVAEFISALIRRGTYDPAAHGFGDEDIYAHRRVHEFAASYQDKAGRAPTKEEILRRFADFPFDDNVDIDWATHQLEQQIKNRKMRVLLTSATSALIEEDPDRAYDILLKAVSTIPVSSEKPISALETDFYFDLAGEACPIAGSTLQGATNGIQPGHVWYVGARPGRGKSWELIRHAVVAAANGWDVAFFSLEMSWSQVLKRIHLLMTGVHDDHLTLAEKVKAWGEVPGRGKISVYDPSIVRCDTRAIEKASKPNTLILIDYVGLMRTTSGQRSIEDHKFAASISNTLKEIALRHNVPIIAASQLNRSAEGSGKSSLTDLAQTDALGQDGDLVYFLRGNSGSRVRELVLVKYRHGPDGQVWHLDFQPHRASFVEISGQRAKALLDIERNQQIEL